MLRMYQNTMHMTLSECCKSILNPSHAQIPPSKLAKLTLHANAPRGEDPQAFEEDVLKSFQINVVSNIHLINQFMPLILAGNAKKVIALSTGMADLDPIIQFEFDNAPGYAISKAAMNVAIGKFHAQYKKQGVLCMSICPGAVETGHFNNSTSFFPLFIFLCN